MSTFNVVSPFSFLLLTFNEKKNLTEVFREKFCVAWHLGAKLAGGFRDSVKGVRGRDMI